VGCLYGAEKGVVPGSHELAARTRYMALGALLPVTFRYSFPRSVAGVTSAEPEDDMNVWEELNGSAQ